MPPKVHKQTTRPVRTAKQGVLARIGPLDVPDEGVKLNLYGRSGTGKTTFWATFPKPILAVIASGGNRPGELRSINTPENRKTIRQVVLERSLEILDIVEHVGSSGEYKTLVLDHATGLQELVLKDLLNLDEVPAQLSWGIASQQQWGQVALQMKQLLRKFLELPLNVVIVAQEREFNTEGDNELLMPYVGSALTPSVTGWLNPACDYICQTFIRRSSTEVTKTVGNKAVKIKKPGDAVEYCLRTGPSEVFTTKVRVPKGADLPEVIVDPSFDKFKELIGC